MADFTQIERSSSIWKKNLTGNNITQGGGIFSGLIESSSGENQNAKLTYPGGSDSISLPMPFESSESWIRSIPQSGSAALIGYRRDTSKAVFIRYLNDSADKKLAAFSAGNNLYKPLLPGEHEIHSSGLAQSYYSQRPILEQRAGIIRSWLDQDRTECGQRSPLHTRQLHSYVSNAIGDEERFGVVRRPTKLGFLNRLLLGEEYSSNFSTYPYPNFSLPGGVPSIYSLTAQAVGAATEAASALTGTFKIRPFGREYLRVLTNPLSPLPPSVLIDIREGQVFDDDGIQLTGDSGAYLRSQRRYFTMLDETTCEIDELGNVSWKLSLEAMQGWTTQIPFGAYKLETALGIDMSTDTSTTISSLMNTTVKALMDLSLDSTLNTSMSTGLNFSHSANGTYDASSLLPMSLASKMNFTAKAGLIFAAQAGVQMNLKAPKVTIGAAPSEPTVMGQTLSTWLQTLCQLFVNNASMVGMGNLSAPVPLNPTVVSGISSLMAQIPLLTSKTITVSA